ncbi:protein ROOT PRIMORDIUM DEFECTIVE 1 [Typha angustifolia]|uniref:protein ROOT PRIMORDIUM DEFECTIVE 1 n=1 Tax=Typha angustifolia TaxID=59011 RepID=UPI003C2DBEBF
MALRIFRVRSILPKVPTFPSNEVFLFGPFTYNLQKRWKKPVDSAQTRLESRTRDLRLDKLMNQLKKLKLVLGLHEFISEQRNGYASVQLLLRWRREVGLNIGIGAFLRKYPHIFEVYTHPVKMNFCCKASQKLIDLIVEEAMTIKLTEPVAIQRLRKLLMMSTNGDLHIHAIWLIRRELGLPDDFRTSILPHYPGDFVLKDLDTLSLVSKDDNFVKAEVEKWREKEYIEKWLSEFETKYAFPINFPTGFKIERGFREKLKNWQRLPYLKPYEKKDAIRVGSVERFEKRAVGILHELLSLMVEKMVPLERLAHFRRAFSMEVNVRELLLKHPGIFYISTKGSTQTVFLREAYSKGCLIEPNPVYDVRRKMLDLVVLGCRNTNTMEHLEELDEIYNKESCNRLNAGPCFESQSEQQQVNGNVSGPDVGSDEETCD